MTIASLYLPGGHARHPQFQVVNAAYAGPTADNRFLYRGASNPVVAELIANAGRTTMHQTIYPTYIHVLSVLVLGGTILSTLAGYLIPGPASGIALPVFFTFWWLLYRAIRRFDDRKIG
jgi:hypothetical protein